MAKEEKMAITMFKKIFLILIMFSIGSYACEGDCISCHPKLVQNGKLDKNHKILSTCKKCHTKESLSKIDMGTDSCGQDCWQCHDIQKVQKTNVKEHKNLDKCIKCHISIDKNKDIFKIGMDCKKIYLADIVKK